MRTMLSVALISLVTSCAYASQTEFRSYCQSSAGEQQYSVSVTSVDAIAQHRQGMLSIQQSSNDSDLSASLTKQANVLFHPSDCVSEMSMANVNKEEPVVRVNFPFDSYGLSPMARTSLKRTSAALTDASYDLIVEGHTDSLGSVQYNQGLGLKRALAVHDVLLFQGVERSKVTVKSLGETEPLVPNTFPQNRAENRRAEIYVVSDK
ncbi:OmpA family protein [Vibrio sp. SCSIO 43140]|uniref:OmpA family protein n=1 Tax=Vibrio sp. SCSIO 43140 TaxID=2819100 RepID=UPI002074B41C|nr:OmpA family protein [Vibrio sp. SCSIO 43140]USD61767.1 OmpA family protein [Vibrio sp. SCSIO 43140]